MTPVTSHEEPGDVTRARGAQSRCHPHAHPQPPLSPPSHRPILLWGGPCTAPPPPQAVLCPRPINSPEPMVALPLLGDIGNIGGGGDVALLVSLHTPLYGISTPFWWSSHRSMVLHCSMVLQPLYGLPATLQPSNHSMLLPPLYGSPVALCSYHLSIVLQPLYGSPATLWSSNRSTTLQPLCSPPLTL